MTYPSRIRTYGDPVLKKKAQKVKHISQDIKVLVRHMLRVMKENQGVGLAAPQIGLSQQVIVVQGKNSASGFLNPKLLKKSRRTSVAEEGCLSIPGLFIPVKRAEKVEVAAQTPAGNSVKITAEGLPARIFQHEIDHLQGKLIIDHVPFLKRISLKRKLNAAR